MEMRAELLDKALGEWGRAEVLDLSWYGVRVRGERLPLKPGRCVDLVIRQASKWDRRRARVAWVKGTGQHASEAGLEFA